MEQVKGLCQAKVEGVSGGAAGLQAWRQKLGPNFCRPPQRTMPVHEFMHEASSICIMTRGLEAMEMESNYWACNLCHRALHSVLAPDLMFCCCSLNILNIRPHIFILHWSPQLIQPVLINGYDCVLSINVGD